METGDEPDVVDTARGRGSAMRLTGGPWDGREVDVGMGVRVLVVPFIPTDGQRDDVRRGEGNKNVQVVYVAGYGDYNPSNGTDSNDFETYDVPQDLVLLAADFIQGSKNAAGTEGKKEERIGDYSYVMGDVSDLSPTSKMTIQRWADGTAAR